MRNMGGDIRGTKEDATHNIKKALLDVVNYQGQEVVINFPKGRYDLYPEEAVKKKYFITNTTSEYENDNLYKAIGISIEDLSHIILEGNDSELIIHGELISFAIKGSSDIRIQNFKIDYERPTISEFQVVEQGEEFINIKVHVDSLYSIENNELRWISESTQEDPSKKYWQYEAKNAITQACDLNEGIAYRIQNGYLFNQAIGLVELDNNLIQLRYDKQDKPLTKLGMIYQMRIVTGARTQVGTLTWESRDIYWENIDMYYMHGLGIVTQLSENCYFNNIACRPRDNSGRTAAAFADFMQFSSVKGEVVIKGCTFIGSHDDAINIHGTHLQIIEQMNQNQIKIRYMHPQTYGFAPFYKDDEIEFINAQTLLPYESNRVCGITANNEDGAREYIVTLQNPISGEIKINSDVVNNISYMPTVMIRDNYFGRIPTRAILLTSRQECVVDKNLFYKMGMSSILIANDAMSWYESGNVSDVTIQENHFICSSQDPVINILPENTVIDPNQSVHTGIKIIKNIFQGQKFEIKCKSTKDIKIEHNRFVGNELLFNMESSQDILIDHNDISEIQKVNEVNK